MTIRNILYDWMNIPRDSAVLPDPLPVNEKGERQYWTTSPLPEEEGWSILRPGWLDPWPDNEGGWARRVVDKVQNDGARWNANARQEELADEPMPTIMNAVHVTFSGWVKAYKKSKKPIVDQSVVRRKQRRNGRKFMVSNMLIGHEIAVLTPEFIEGSKPQGLSRTIARDCRTRVGVHQGDDVSVH